MIGVSKQMVRIFAKGGILTPSYLIGILKIAKKTGNKHVHFGSRQDILFQVSTAQMPIINDGFKSLQTDYVVHGRKGTQFQNIVSSYVSSDMAAATSWLSSGTYLFILEQFNFKPTLRINIADPKQSLVPLFYGHLNFIASSLKDYWYLYIRRDEISVPERWPVMILSSDISLLSKNIETEWPKLLYGGISGFFAYLNEKTNYNWRKIENDLTLDSIPPQDYEGFGKMNASVNYWAGFYWRNNSYDISFLEEMCSLCLRTNISKICLTPWKSFLIKEINEKDLIHWHRLLGRFGINMRHSSFELNWHLPLLDKQALKLKRYIVKKFDKVDVCVHGLTFGIKTKQEPALTNVLIEKKHGLKFMKELDPFITYKIYHTRNFNANTWLYEEYMTHVSRKHLPGALQNVASKYYAQLLDTAERIEHNPKIEKTDNSYVYQCQTCFSIHDEQTGDSNRGIAANTKFSDLPETFCCPLCEAPKSSFRKTQMSKIIQEANL